MAIENSIEYNIIESNINVNADSQEKIIFHAAVNLRMCESAIFENNIIEIEFD